MSTKYDRLRNLLLELFQLDKPDLDFGIYRIMHARADEISRFLDIDLLPQVREALASYDQGNRTQIETELAQLLTTLTNAGVDPETSTKVIELRVQLADASKADAIEGEVYDLIYRFFSRYYSEGDFISQRRYTSESSYAIPYNGEEVTLHWANKDQYYIKTSEYLRDYAFRLNIHDDANPMRVHFRLVDAAEGEHGNVKAAEAAARVFVLADRGDSGHDFLSVDNGELTISFEYRPATGADWPTDQRASQAKPPKQKDLVALTEAAVLSCTQADLAQWIRGLAPLRPGSAKSMIAAHVERYVARNTFDYFIHKDLGGFLRRELDFFIKNEVMRLDDIEDESAPKVEQYLGKIKAVRRVAGKIIDFLAQLEDFQKKLWLKKKFVVGTSYLITVGNIGDGFHPEICANDAQRDEWVRLFAIDTIEGDLVTTGYSLPLTPKFLQTHPTLTLNTDLFDGDFASRLLESCDDCDSSADLVLVHGDNAQALALLSSRYRQQAAMTYIDPPYNTGDDGFPYKDSYQHSSWLSMMADRLALGREMEGPLATVAISIDDAEMHRLTDVAAHVYGDAELAKLVWDRNRKNDAKYFSVGHEYMLLLAKDKSALKSAAVKFREPKEGLDAARNVFANLRTEHGDDWEAIRRGWLAWFDNISVSDPRRRLMRYTKVGERGPYRDDGDPSWPGGGGPRYEVVHPVTRKPCKIPRSGWRFPTAERFQEAVAEGRIEFGLDESTIPSMKRFAFEGDGQVMPSVFYSYAQIASQEFDTIFGGRVFDNPKNWRDLARLIRYMSKPGDLVVDYFAGSGSTGHAVINLHRSDGDRRQALLIEMGAHFDTVTLPRLRRITFSPEWSEGSPTRAASSVEAERSPRIMKVLRLESYEDTLNNLDLRRSEVQQSLLDNPAAAALREDYTLRYMLDVESRGDQSLLNIEAFTDPTAYQLRVKAPGSDESRLVNADLLETFNYLIGLTVVQITAPRTFEGTFRRDEEKRLHVDTLKQAADGGYWFRTVTGTDPAGQRVLVIWRKRPGDDGSEGIEQDNAVLDHWFTNKQQYSVRDSEFDVIYVNGDNNLENLRRSDETWKVRLIEEDFHRLMFDTTGMP